MTICLKFCWSIIRFTNIDQSVRNDKGQYDLKFDDLLGVIFTNRYKGIRKSL